MGDCRSALPVVADQIVQGCTQNADIVDTAMLVKTIVFNSQDSLFHDIRNFVDSDEVASFLSEFTHQYVICRVNAQGHFWMIIRQLIHWWQFGINQGHRQYDNECTD